MLITPGTLGEWAGRLEEEGPDALVQLSTPVNRFPDLVAYVVQRLKVHLPALGKVAIAQHLARAGLHLSPSTVHRMLRRSNPPPAHSVEVPEPALKRVLTPVIAERPHHVWQMDFTVWPLFGGLWTPWPPFFSWAWPFAVWVAGIIDQHSRHVVGVEVMRRAPRGEDALSALEQAIDKFGAPKYLIVDLGTHFQNGTFLEGCARHGISVRCASRDSLRATAHVERFIRTLKAELPWAPGDLLTSRLASRIQQYLLWYHAHRPHQGLEGRTPNEVVQAQRPANKRPRHEPRPRWPRGARCANPQAPPRRAPPGRLALVVDRDEIGLPIVRLERAA